MPVFWLLLIIGLVLLWFLLAFAFKPLGKFFYRLWKDAMEEINEGENK